MDRQTLNYVFSLPNPKQYWKNSVWHRFLRLFSVKSVWMLHWPLMKCWHGYCYLFIQKWDDYFLWEYILRFLSEIWTFLYDGVICHIGPNERAPVTEAIIFLGTRWVNIGFIRLPLKIYQRTKEKVDWAFCNLL